MVRRPGHVSNLNGKSLCGQWNLNEKSLRYNDYTKDEFSKCNCNPPYSAEAAISARGDLNPANGTYEFPGQGHVNHGALDYKVNVAHDNPTCMVVIPKYFREQM